jgi:23S rRNA pseudouridine1911/1915/1917 synthase
MSSESRGAGEAVSIVATEEQDGLRIDVLLATVLGVSRSAAAQRIDAGAVAVNGRTVRRSRTVAVGDLVEVDELVPTPVGPAPDVPPIRYQDEHLVVVAKPPGLVVHPGTGHDGDTLVDALRAAGIPLAVGSDPTRPGIVHRLDRDTSGLLVVACTPLALEGFTAMLAARTVERRYFALVAGVPMEPRGVVDAPIGRHPSHRTRFAVVEGGRPARTRYRTVGEGSVRTSDGSLRTIGALVCGLETGRTHQIRVHLDAIGTPVAGDPVYGADRGLAAALGIERPALHAAHLSFPHPVTGVTVAVTEPLPSDLLDAWERAGIDRPDGSETP